MRSRGLLLADLLALPAPAPARWKQRSTPLQVVLGPSKSNFLYQAAAGDHNEARPRLLSGSRPSL
jgi:hypothetical protein